MAEADLTSRPTSKAEKIIAPAKGLAANSIGKAYRGRVVVKDITLTVPVSYTHLTLPTKA